MHHGRSFPVLDPDVVRAGRAGGRPYRVAARVPGRQTDRAGVGHVVPDPDPAGRPAAYRGAVGGRAPGRRRGAAPVPADGRRPGRRPYGAGRGGTETAVRGPAAAGDRGRRVMDQLTRMLPGRVRGRAGVLGEHRRDWVHALLAETDDLPARSARLAWLSGGLLLVVREVLMNRIIQALVFAAGAVGLVWIGWPGASTNSATPVNRMYVVGTLVLLAGLPLLVRRYVGPVRPGWAPLVTRVGGYAVVLALVAATAVRERIGSQLGRYFPVIAPVWAMDVGFLLILASYVAGLLILTARRVQFTRRVLPFALGIGALTAGVLYLLAPSGIGDAAEAAAHSLHGGPVVVADYLLLACFALAALAVPVAVHAVATRLADRDTRPGLLTPARHALLGTDCANATPATQVARFISRTIAGGPPSALAHLGVSIFLTCDPNT